VTHLDIQSFFDQFVLKFWEREPLLHYYGKEEERMKKGTGDGRLLRWLFTVLLHSASQQMKTRLQCHCSRSLVAGSNLDKVRK
jgi:hypothetical protein